MKVGIDARALRVEGGSKVYAVNLLSNIKDKGDFILFGVDKFDGFNCIPSKIKNNSILRLYYENVTLPKLIKKNNINIFHGLKGVAPIFGKFKKIVTIHDIIPLIYPEQFKSKDLFYWRVIFPQYIRKVDRIITSSENTKKDLMKLLKVSEEKINVILLAQDEIYKPIKNKGVLDKIKEKYSLSNNFIFYSGSINPRKNLKRVIEAFQQIQSKIDYDLIITGGTIWKSKHETEMISNNSRIKVLGLVPKEDLVSLYNLAKVYVYPSLYEGFGLPILEAQACGCPVITSNISSMPEVSGNGAILVDPYDVDEIARSMERIIRDKKLRNSLIKEGYKNVKRFSWDKCAKETMKVYEEVYK
ncbi:MAG: glycosyltransferase family 1 protein [Candidatus Pacearchaeota archaeon]|jgi:glycosyltransferase involved in cell wall biosynthesis